MSHWSTVVRMEAKYSLENKVMKKEKEGEGTVIRKEGGRAAGDPLRTLWEGLVGWLVFVFVGAISSC